MGKMTDKEYVSGLKHNMHMVFDTPQGKEVLRFLEVHCCWYKSVFVPDSPDMTLINDGKRQVIATIKTILELNPDQIVLLAGGEDAV
jgi:hypothetical protein